MKKVLLTCWVPILFFIGCEKNDYNDFDGSSYNDVADFRLSFDYHEEWGTIKELPFEFNSTNYNMAKYGHVHNDVMNQLRDVLMEIDYCDPEEMSNYIVAIDSVKALNNLNLFDTWVFESGLDQL
ncbi:MAG: hypothetical protein EA411_12780 [Saprospirales bacterium]|nr:MAG: hypothetical protein EA411_12780 [Saprospirales bacterium]